MSVLLQEEKNDNNIGKKNNKDNMLTKCFKGIWIYFKDYVLFLKGSTIKLFKMMNYATYHWGLQMIFFIGMTQSYGAVNLMAHHLSPFLVHEGKID